MTTTISAGIQGFVDQHDNVRDLLKAIDEQFTTYDKSLANTLIMWFLSMKLTRIKEVCDHIIHIRNILAQWKALEVTMLIRQIGKSVVFTFSLTQSTGLASIRQARHSVAKRKQES
ncbi:hypothetical protein HKD37_18G051209 [Glycine soja]